MPLHWHAALTVENNQMKKAQQTLPIQERTTPYHQDSKISSVITPASQELVSSFCTAGGAPVVDSIVPKDTGMITQLPFRCVVLWIGIARRKSGYRNINRYAAGNGVY